MNKVVVTGATGFIGQELVKQLLVLGYDVKALVRSSATTGCLPKNVQRHQGDLCDGASLNGLCKHGDTVFHLGGYAHAWAENNAKFAQDQWQINVEGTEHLLAEAKRAGCQTFIYFSSVKAVGDAEHIVDENFDEAPTTPYGKAKRAAEEAVLAAGNDIDIGMHVTILRPTLVYGPNCKGNLQSLMTLAKLRLPFTFPDVANARSLISVYDICRAAIKAATHPAANGKIYFVAENKPYSIADIWKAMLKLHRQFFQPITLPYKYFKLMADVGEKMGKAFGKRLPINQDVLQKLFGSALYNSTKIQEDIGFMPRDNLGQILPAMLAAQKKAK